LIVFTRCLNWILSRSASKRVRDKKTCRGDTIICQLVWSSASTRFETEKHHLKNKFVNTLCDHLQMTRCNTTVIVAVLKLDAGPDGKTTEKSPRLRTFSTIKIRSGSPRVWSGRHKIRQLPRPVSLGAFRGHVLADLVFDRCVVG